MLHNMDKWVVWRNLFAILIYEWRKTKIPISKFYQLLCSLTFSL